MAELRNMQRDDAEQHAGAQQEETEATESGNDDQHDIADARDMEGSDVRTATEDEAHAERPREASREPPPNLRARGDTARTGAAEAAAGAADSEHGGQEGGRVATGGGTRQRGNSSTSCNGS